MSVIGFVGALEFYAFVWAALTLLAGIGFFITWSLAKEFFERK